jgi:uncharacterized membrane protein YfcA
MVVADADTLTDGTGIGNTFMVIPLLVAVAGEAQGALDVMITVTTSLLLSPELLKVELLVPVLEPFTCHW